MKKNLLSIIALLMVFMLLFSACSSGTQAPAEEPETPPETAEEAPETAEAPADEEAAVPATSDETLRVMVNGEPSNLVPLNASMDTAGATIAFCFYDTLIDYDTETGEYIPRVASDWEWVDDTHLRLTIRDDIVAYDGTTLTANDVMYSIERGLEGTSATFWTMVDLAECSVEDDYTIVIGLNQVYPTLVNLLAVYGMLTIVDESSVEALGGWEAIARNPQCTTGRYFFDEWVDGQYIRLVRNDNYFGEKAYYKYIEFSFVSDSTARAMALQSGEADFSTYLNRADTLSLTGYNDCVVYDAYAQRSQAVWFNCSKAPFDDARVREAIYLLIDQNAANVVMTGGDAPLCETHFTPTNAYYAAPEDAAAREVNVERAKELLAEAGYADGFDCSFLCFIPHQSLAEVIQANLAAANININIEVVEIAALFTRFGAGEYDMYCTDYSGDDPVRLLNTIDGRIPTNECNGGAQYMDEELCEIIDQARYSTDAAIREQAYADVQAHIRDNFVVVGLYQNTNYYASSASFDGLRTNISGELLLDLAKPAA